MALRFKDYARILKGEAGYSPTKAQYRSASNPNDVISGRQFTTGAKGGVRYETIAKKSGGSLRKPGAAPAAPKPTPSLPKKSDILSYLPGWKKERVGNKTQYVSETGVRLSPARAKQYVQGKPLRDVWAAAMGGKKINTAFQQKYGITQYEFLDKASLLTFIARAGLEKRYSVTAMGQTKTAGGSGGDESGRLKWRGRFFPSPPYEWMSLGSYDESVKHPDRGIAEREVRYFGSGIIVVYSISF